MHKQIAYTGLRLGMYEHLTADTDALPLHLKVLYATVTTGFGIVVANPSDVVQTKFIAYRTKHPIRPPLSSAAKRSVPHPTTAAAAAAPPGDSRRTFATHEGPHRHRRREVTWVAGSMAGASGQRGRGLFAHSTWQRHVYRHHWRRPPLLCLLRTLCSEPGAPKVLPVAARPPPPPGWVPRGPKTANGVPLQNARMAYYVILREEGLVNGLYRGFWANFACSCVQGAAEIVAYDVTKTTAVDAGCTDSAPLHLAAGATPPHLRCNQV